jgi:hypothetical protein
LNENDEIVKRTILDLCAHMFYPKSNLTNSEELSGLENDDMRADDKIKDFEN